METKEKIDQSNDPGREGSNNSVKQGKGNVGQQIQDPGGKKTGANRDEDKEPKGEDEHGK